MDARKNRVSVGGLRTADVASLAVLTQDVLRLPLGQIEPTTIMDLLALSEAADQVGAVLARDLGAFREQMIRELADLPDGPPLVAYLAEVAAIANDQVPSSFREGVAALTDERKYADAVTAIQALIEQWKGSPPATIQLPVAAKKAPAKKKATAAKKAPAKKKTTAKRRSPTVVDERREEWIREDVAGRLANYGSTGLKEPVIVAGARYRAPWKDLTEAEVLAILRKLKREGKLRYSAGRWSLNR